MRRKSFKPFYGKCSTHYVMLIKKTALWQYGTSYTILVLITPIVITNSGRRVN